MNFKAGRLVRLAAVNMLLAAVLLTLFFRWDYFRERTFSLTQPLIYPALTRIADDGSVYLVERGYKQLTRMDRNGNVQYSLRGGERNGRFYEAWDLCPAPDGGISVYNAERDIDTGKYCREQILTFSGSGEHTGGILDNSYGSDSQREEELENTARVFGLKSSGGFLHWIFIEKPGVFSLHTYSAAKGKEEPVITFSTGSSLSDAAYGPAGTFLTTQRGDVLKLEPDGSLRKAVFAGPAIRGARYICQDRTGTLYILDMFQRTVFRAAGGRVKALIDSSTLAAQGYRSEGMILQHFDADSTGNIVLLDSAKNSVLLLSSEGRLESVISARTLPCSYRIRAVEFYILIVLASAAVLFNLGAVYLRIFRRRVPLLLKLLLICVPLFVISTALIVNEVFRATFERYENEYRNKLCFAAQIAAPSIDGAALSRITRPSDYMNADYQSLEKQLTDLVRDNGNRWNRELYALLYTCSDGVFYYTVVPGGQYGTLYPYRYSTAAHVSAFTKGEVSSEIAKDHEGTWIYGVSPVRDTAGKITGVIEIGANYSELDAAHHIFFAKLTRGTLIAVAVQTAAFSVFAFLLLASIRKLRSAASRVSSTDFDARVNIRSRDEIEDLGHDFNRMAGQLKSYVGEITTLKDAYIRFVPQQFLQFLQRDSICDVTLGDQVQKEMTVMFCDIRAFTTLSESMTPSENFQFINSFLRRMEPAIHRNSGFIDKFIGDAIMALFIKPDDAMKAADEMLKELELYNADRLKSGYQPISIGIGLHTGSLILGVIGGEHRIDTTVIADAVNLASRIESLTKKFKAPLLVSKETLMRLDNPSKYLCRYLGRARVKGKQETVSIYEIFDNDPEQIRRLKMETRQSFECALYHYYAEDYRSAAEEFSSVLSSFPDDTIAAFFLDDCENILYKREVEKKGDF